VDPTQDNPLRQAPGLGTAGRDAPGTALPGLDDRLVVPETTREEMLDGRRLHAVPAEPQHGDPHCRLDFLIAAHAKPGYVGSTDLLTRVDGDSDFASDTCIRRDGIDPRTGRRHLEELAFEVIHRRSRQENDRRAALMMARGVRRVIGVFVLTEVVADFNPDTGRWQRLAPGAVIDDPCLVRPLPVRALLDSALANAAVVAALERRGEPALEALKRTSAEAGRLAGTAAVVKRQLERRFGPLPEAAQARIDGASAEELARLADAVLEAESLEAVFRG
jgi:hypothetical protein